MLSPPRRGSAPLLRTVPAWEALSAEPATNLTLAQLLGAAPAGGGAHYGSGTPDTRIEMNEMGLRNLEAFFAGRPLVTPIPGFAG